MIKFKLNYKTLILTAFLSSVFSTLSGNEKDIKALLLMLECEKGIHNELVEYEMNEDSTFSKLKYIRHGLFMDDKLYREMNLNWKDGKIVSGTHIAYKDTNNISVSYKDDHIYIINIEGDGRVRHKAEYDEGKIINLYEIVKTGSPTQKYYSFEYYDDGKLKSVSLFLSDIKTKKKAPFHECIYTYNDNNCQKQITMYSGIETRKFKKKLYKKETYTFEKSSIDKKFSTTNYEDKIDQIWSVKSEYDNENRLINRLETIKNKKGVAEITNIKEWDNELIIKNTSKKAHDGKFDFHKVGINYKLDPATNKYVVLGDGDTTYLSYDELGEVIEETRKKENSLIHRIKENGIWSDWMYKRY